MAMKEDDSGSPVAVMDSVEAVELPAEDDKVISDSDASRLLHSGDITRNGMMRKPSSSSSGVFDGDDLVVEFVAQLVEASMKKSIEAFYERKLCGYASRSASDAMFEVIFSVLQARPHPKCERNDSKVNRENDPVMRVVCSPEKALHTEPQQSEIDPFC